MLPPNADGSRVEGGFAVTQPDLNVLSIYDAAMSYIARGTPTVIFAGEEYGTGSSRDWAAKGTQLLGSRRSLPGVSSASIVPTWSGWACCRCQFRGGRIRGRRSKPDGATRRWIWL